MQVEGQMPEAGKTRRQRECVAEAADPLVTVVIPTYNRADLIPETIESVLGQTYRNLEIIVVDDGSTDATADVIERFTPTVRYVRQRNSERGAARNNGLRRARGEFIAFLDSDDLWLPDKIERDVAFLQSHPAVGLIYTNALLIDEEGRVLRVLRARGPSGHVTGSLLRRNFVSMGTHLARTNLVREIGGFREERNLSGSEDWEMWVRLSLITRFAYLDRVSAKLRTHPANTMTDPKAMHRSMAQAAKLFRERKCLASTYPGSLPRMEANIALVNAINHCPRYAKDSMNFLRDAFGHHPAIVLDPRFGYTAYRLIRNSLRP